MIRARSIATWVVAGMACAGAGCGSSHRATPDVDVTADASDLEFDASVDAMSVDAMSVDASDASVDAISADAGDASDLLVFEDASDTAAPEACVPAQACVPSDACHVGLTSCTAHGPVCGDTLGYVPDGTSCGADRVCQNGVCHACVAGVACTPAPAPCLSQAGATSCETGQSTCVPTSIVPDGTLCAEGSQCYAARCVDALEFSAPPSIDPTGNSGVQASGTRGVPLTAVLATSLGLPPSYAGDLFAVVNWGDGVSSSATVTAVARGIVVTGTHTFETAGTFWVTVTVTSKSTGLTESVMLQALASAP